MSYLKYQGKIYKMVEGGFTARQSDLDSMVDVDAEISKLKGFETAYSKMVPKMADMEKEIAGLKAHNLELTQALKAIRDFEDDDNDDSFTLGVCKAKAEQILSSPASRKYLAMIAVVEAAKEWGKNKDSHKESQIKLCDAIVNIEALESEEA